jgi:hypothetical protein
VAPITDSEDHRWIISVGEDNEDGSAAQYRLGCEGRSAVASLEVSLVPRGPSVGWCTACLTLMQNATRTARTVDISEGRGAAIPDRVASPTLDIH